MGYHLRSRVLPNPAQNTLIAHYISGHALAETCHHCEVCSPERTDMRATDR
jgi:hypothetical protein